MLYYSSRSITSSKPIVRSSDIWIWPLKRNLRLVQRSNLSDKLSCDRFLYSVLDSSVSQNSRRIIYSSRFCVLVSHHDKIKSYLPPDCTSLPSPVVAKPTGSSWFFKIFSLTISWSTSSLDQPKYCKPCFVSFVTLEAPQSAYYAWLSYPQLCCSITPNRLGHRYYWEIGLMVVKHLVPPSAFRFSHLSELQFRTFSFRGWACR
jgi:hypothetical protein